MGRAFYLAVVLAAAAPSAHAETIVIRPDPCPAGADQPLIIDLGEVEVFNASPEAALGEVLVIYPPIGQGWASARLLMRFNLDEPGAPPRTEGCGPRRIFRLPR